MVEETMSWIEDLANYLSSFIANLWDAVDPLSAGDYRRMSLGLHLAWLGFSCHRSKRGYAAYSSSPISWRMLVVPLRRLQWILGLYCCGVQSMSCGRPPGLAEVSMSFLLRNSRRLGPRLALCPVSSETGT